MRNRELSWTAKALLIAFVGSAIGMVFVALASASDFTLIDDKLGKLAIGDACTKCDRAYRRCQRESCPTPTALPSPTPSQSPKPTGSPLPCEPIGGVKTYQVGEEKMLCFDAGPKRPWVEVNSINLKDASCSTLAMHLAAPSGATSDDIGAQPGSILPWEPGQFFLWTKLVWGCNRYTFTAR